MYTLFHHPFCPQSRFIRLALGEHGLDLRLVEERVWERREAFLALNPSGTTPVLISEGQPAIPGAGIIAEYLDETHGAEMGERRLLPTAIAERIEGRRARDRGRRSKGVVRAGEIPPVVPSAAERMAGGRAGVAHLRGPRLLNAHSKLSAADLKAALASEARALGFDCVGVTAPDAIA